ncbi:hypothetical protein [Neorhizobium galegae]|uniref:hypothetical protein n=1 Tax=Neorhizobium galegae TaxID=399 RepID=UPI00127945A6|nr:hypothetical protein [Neorhizobium galegae]KAA9385722.1 hypothetical protein F4V88_04210 [Neorhizobium galegae]MCM2497337.1 hypothetical protein [Neorhizobium galegae]
MPESELTVLSGAVKSAAAAVVGAPLEAALRWDDRLLEDGEIPDVFLPDRRMVLIFLLPRVLKALGLPMASFYASLWQYGHGEYGSLKERTPYLEDWYWRPKLSDFMDSTTVAVGVSSFIDQLISELPTMEALIGNWERWEQLRTIARELRANHKGEDTWVETPPDYRGTIGNPFIYLGHKSVNTADFVLKGESITESDAYVALGPFGLRAYMHADILKKPGDERLFVSPKRVAVRIYDSYGFTDGGLDQVLGAMLGFRATQFLGRWANTQTGEKIALANDDFNRYRQDFKPIYNSYLESKSGNRSRLVCRDFETFSDYIERDVAGNQYALAGA